MKNLLLIALLLAFMGALAQDTNYVDPNYQAPKERKSKAKKRESFGQRIYYGGTFGLSFGDITSVLVEPLVGYRVTERLSTGVGLGIRYGKDNRPNSNIEFTNYLGRVFGRFLLNERIYAHTEFMAESYDKVFYFDSDPFHEGRTLVPFWFVGGGFRSPAGNGSFIFQILFNVLNDPKSQEVYPSGFPSLSIGYIGGF